MLLLLLACGSDTPAVVGDAAAPIADAGWTRAKSRAPGGFTVVPAGPFVGAGPQGVATAGRNSATIPIPTKMRPRPTSCNADTCANSRRRSSPTRIGPATMSELV